MTTDKIALLPNGRWSLVRASDHTRAKFGIIDEAHNWILSNLSKSEAEEVIAAYNTAYDAATRTQPKEAPASSETGRVAVLEAAIRWALGEAGEFAPKPANKGNYWWRTELRQRADLASPSDGRVEEMEARLAEAEADRDTFHRDWQGLLEHHEQVEIALEAVLKGAPRTGVTDEAYRVLGLQGDMKPSDLSALKAKLSKLERVAEAAKEMLRLWNEGTMENHIWALAAIDLETALAALSPKPSLGEKPHA